MSQDSADIVRELKRAEHDTGSPEVQVALFTHRIAYLTKHFAEHKKDTHSKYGMQALVNKRKKMLKYLKRESVDRYYALIKKLSLRDLMDVKKRSL